jgi:hypothetical protein
MAEMIELVFHGEEPVEIVLQGQPETRCVENTLEVTLPVFAGGLPNATAKMQMYLSIEQAEHLLGQLQAGLVTARVRQRAAS